MVREYQWLLTAGKLLPGPAGFTRGTGGKIAAKMVMHRRCSADWRCLD